MHAYLGLHSASQLPTKATRSISREQKGQDGRRDIPWLRATHKWDTVNATMHNQWQRISYLPLEVYAISLDRDVSHIVDYAISLEHGRDIILSLDKLTPRSSKSLFEHVEQLSTTQAGCIDMTGSEHSDLSRRFKRPLTTCLILWCFITWTHNGIKVFLKIYGSILKYLN